MSKSTQIIGARLKRDDARGKTTGETKFLTDIKVDNMLHAAPVFSQVAYGKLLGIDTRVAENDPDYIDMLYRHKFNYVTEDEIIIKLK